MRRFAAIVVLGVGIVLSVATSNYTLENNTYVDTSGSMEVAGEGSITLAISAWSDRRGRRDATLDVILEMAAWAEDVDSGDTATGLPIAVRVGESGNWSRFRCEEGEQCRVEVPVVFETDSTGPMLVHWSAMVNGRWKEAEGAGIAVEQIE